MLKLVNRQYAAANYPAAKSQRSTLGWLLLTTSLLATSGTAVAQTALQTALDGGRRATLVRVASRQLREVDSVARASGRKPDMVRIDKINPAASQRGFFIVTSAAGAVEKLPALASGGGMVDLIEAVEQQLVSAPPMKDKPLAETSVYAMLTIGTDGLVQQATIVEGQDATTNAAVLAAVQRLPRLTPGQVAGTAVPVKLTFPVQVRH